MSKMKSKPIPKSPAKSKKLQSKSIAELIDAWHGADADLEISKAMTLAARDREATASFALAERVFGKRTKTEDKRMACVQCGGEYYLVERENLSFDDDDYIVSVERVEFVKE